MKLLDEWHLKTRWIGHRVLIYDEVGSTNDVASALATDEQNHGVVILTERQQAGRGQHGRRWEAQANSSVLLSTLLFPPDFMRRPVILTACAAVAVCRTIEKIISVPPQIKWPNDVLINGKKTCGILIEQERGTVIGIGLNVQQDQQTFDTMNLPEATSLSLWTDADLNTKECARHLIEALDELWERLLQRDLQDLEQEWKQRFGLLNRRVQVELVDGCEEGTLLEMSFDAIAIESQSWAPERIQHLTSLSTEAEITIEFYGIPRLRSGCAEMKVNAQSALDALRMVQAHYPQWTDLMNGDQLTSHYRLSLEGKEFIIDISQKIPTGSHLLLLSADVGG